ncbi:hypothetical protein IW262DRAFT_1293899 [Armillaria fumosa]|nr:hypothetical protein IW262DRAFT_1293899 [Armillaria fumosa]
MFSIEGDKISLREIGGIMKFRKVKICRWASAVFQDQTALAIVLAAPKTKGIKKPCAGVRTLATMEDGMATDNCAMADGIFRIYWSPRRSSEARSQIMTTVTMTMPIRSLSFLVVLAEMKCYMRARVEKLLNVRTPYFYTLYTSHILHETLLRVIGITQTRIYSQQLWTTLLSDESFDHLLTLSDHCLAEIVLLRPLSTIRTMPLLIDLRPYSNGLCTGSTSLNICLLESPEELLPAVRGRLDTIGTGVHKDVHKPRYGMSPYEACSPCYCVGNYGTESPSSTESRILHSTSSTNDNNFQLTGNEAKFRPSVGPLDIVADGRRRHTASQASELGGCDLKQLLHIYRGWAGTRKRNDRESQAAQNLTLRLEECLQGSTRQNFSKESEIQGQDQPRVSVFHLASSFSLLKHKRSPIQGAPATLRIAMATTRQNKYLVNNKPLEAFNRRNVRRSVYARAILTLNPVQPDEAQPNGHKQDYTFTANQSQKQPRPWRSKIAYIIHEGRHGDDGDLSGGGLHNA